MDESTIRRLNQLNRAFYRLTAENFDESRGRPWPGWMRLLPHLAGVTPLCVLDVGCGNGRFGRFLARNLDRPVRYHGMDSSPELLSAAQAAFARAGILPDAVLEERDIVEQPPSPSEREVYDLVALFGVLHHVPGAAQRRTLLGALADRVARGSLLVFTEWRFYEHERFRERIIPWPDDLSRESGDYLMDWRRGHTAHTALRYCHYIGEDEHMELIALLNAHGLREIAAFNADGHTNDINRYSVLARA